MIKKLATTLFGLLISSSAFALPLGNPWEASLMCDGIVREGNCYNDPSCWNLCDSWSFRIGFYGDYVFNKHMENAKQEGRPTLHEYQVYTNAGYLAFNLWDRIDLFGTLGASHIYGVFNSSAAGGASNLRAFLETDTSFSWSVGGRATIWECGCFGFGLEGQYFRSCLDRNFSRIEDQAPDYGDSVGVTLREWQVGVGSAYRINIADCSTALIPYIGMKVSHARATNTIGNAFESAHYFGYAIGATLLGCNKGSITVEGRFLNETAVYVNGQVRF